MKKPHAILTQFSRNPHTKQNAPQAIILAKLEKYIAKHIPC